MKSFSLNLMKKGCFIGSFEPSALKNSGLEVSIKHFEAGEPVKNHDRYYREKDTEIIVILSGVVDVMGRRFAEGSIIKWNPGEVIMMQGIESGSFLMIKSPGSKRDLHKIDYSNLDDMKYLCLNASFERGKVDSSNCMPINPDQVTVVVQGGIAPKQYELVSESIRTHLPGAKIVLSTWKNSDIDDADYDTVILNEDPGAAVAGKFYEGADAPDVLNNCNRQIVSSRSGLEKVSTEYALKLRSDMILAGDGILRCYEKKESTDDKYSVFSHRIVIGELYSRYYYSYQRGGKWNSVPTPFHPSDWFQFGKTQDLIKLYSNAEKEVYTSC